MFNYVTYPYLTRLFRDLDVPVIKSEMSFGASINDGLAGIRPEHHGIRHHSAKKQSAAAAVSIKMIADIIRLRKACRGGRHGMTIKTIGELVDELGLGDRGFATTILMPMCGAIWSTPVEDIDQFPAKSLVQFFRNHALLAGSGEHQWWTVKGGSIEYVRRLESALLVARGCVIRTDTPVRYVQRDAHEVRSSSPTR